MPKININSIDFESDDQKVGKKLKQQPKKMKPKEGESTKKPKKQ